MIQIEGKQYYNKAEVDVEIDNAIGQLMVNMTRVHADLYTRLDRIAEILSAELHIDPFE